MLLDNPLSERWSGTGLSNSCSREGSNIAWGVVKRPSLRRLQSAVYWTNHTLHIEMGLTTNWNQLLLQQGTMLYYFLWLCSIKFFSWGRSSFWRTIECLPRWLLSSLVLLVQSHCSLEYLPTIWLTKWVKMPVWAHTWCDLWPLMG